MARAGTREAADLRYLTVLRTERLGQLVGHVSRKELDGIDDALRIAPQLD
ncbi:MULTISPECIES: hypothetical protein [unclassified Cryobacterium]|nr:MULTISPECIES: hypothetical protein [unclassified Cryobacterium]